MNKIYDKNVYFIVINKIIKMLKFRINNKL